jgi:hypothetical protein
LEKETGRPYAGPALVLHYNSIRGRAVGAPSRGQKPDVGRFAPVIDAKLLKVAASVKQNILESKQYSFGMAKNLKLDIFRFPVKMRT